MGVKKTITYFVFFLLFLNVCALGQTDNDKVDVYLFYGEGCAHCGKILEFFDKIEEKYPEMNLIKKEIYFNKENALLMQDFCNQINTQLEGVPTVFIDNKAYVGYSLALAVEIEQKIKSCIKTKDCCNLEEDISNNKKNQTDIDTNSPNWGKDYSNIGYIFISIIFVLILYSLIKKQNKK